MANRIRTGNPMNSIKDVVRQSPEEDRRTYRPKHCGNNNKDEDHSPKTLNDKKYLEYEMNFFLLTSIFFPPVI